MPGFWHEFAQNSAQTRFRAAHICMFWVVLCNFSRTCLGSCPAEIRPEIWSSGGGNLENGEAGYHCAMRQVRRSLDLLVFFLYLRKADLWLENLDEFFHAALLRA
jgi:hypothetical protein